MGKDRSICGRGSHFALQLTRAVRDPWSIDCRIDEVDIIESELYEESNTLAGEGSFRFDLSTARHHIALLTLCSHVVGDEPLVIFILLSRLRLAFTTRKNSVPTCLHILLYRCKLVVHSEFPLTKIHGRHEAVLIWSDIPGRRDLYSFNPVPYLSAFEGQDCSSSLAFPKPPPQLLVYIPRPSSDTDTAVRLKTPVTSLTDLDNTAGSWPTCFAIFYRTRLATPEHTGLDRSNVSILFSIRSSSHSLRI